MKILLAEDNTVNQRVAIGMLQMLGYNADVAVNGREAVEAVEHDRYDLVFMDVHMPEMDGVEATRVIHERFGDDDRPLIVAMTANALKGDREELIAAGMDDYVSKPVRIEALTAVVEACIARLGKGPDADGSDSDPTHVIDLSVFDAFEALGADAHETVALIIDSYLEEAPRLMSVLNRHVASGDFTAAGLAAHSLKASSASVGALPLAALLQDIETAGKEGNGRTVRDKAPRATAALDAVVRQLQAHIASNLA